MPIVVSHEAPVHVRGTSSFAYIVIPDFSFGLVDRKIEELPQTGDTILASRHAIDDVDIIIQIHDWCGLENIVVFI
jgi:hypothetical protein